jgi:hypothetical protein
MRQFVFIYKGRLDTKRFNTEERCRKASAFLLQCFETHTASQRVVGDDTKVHVNAPSGIIEFGCTLRDVGPTEEAELVEYFKRCVSTLNAIDDQKFAQLGW